MTKLGKMHCFMVIWTIGEQVNTQLNLAHWGSWDTVIKGHRESEMNSLLIYTPKFKKGALYAWNIRFMAGAASQAGDADSSRAPGLTSGFQGSVNVQRGALLLVPQWHCISSFVFYICLDIPRDADKT